MILSKSGPHAYQRRLDITNTEHDILDQVITFGGLGRISANSRRNSPAHHKLRLVWYVAAWREIEYVAGRLYPFLRKRRRAAMGRLFDLPPSYFMAPDQSGTQTRVRLNSLKDPRTNVREPDASEWWAWAAGLFEGEGSAVCRPSSYRSKGIQRRLQISMSDEDVLLRFRDVVGAGGVRPFETTNVKRGQATKADVSLDVF